LRAFLVEQKEKGKFRATGAKERVWAPLLPPASQGKVFPSSVYFFLSSEKERGRKKKEILLSTRAKRRKGDFACSFTCGAVKGRGEREKPFPLEHSGESRKITNPFYVEEGGKERGGRQFDVW